MARDDQVVKDYLIKSAVEREKMVSKALSIIDNASLAMQQRLCTGLQDMVTASDDRLLVDIQLTFLVKMKKQ